MATLGWSCPPTSDTVHYMHGGSCGGHFGASNTLRKLHKWYYWKGMDNGVDRWYSACQHCTKHKVKQNTHQGTYDCHRSLQPDINSHSHRATRYQQSLIEQPDINSHSNRATRHQPDNYIKDYKLILAN